MREACPGFRFAHPGYDDRALGGSAGRSTSASGSVSRQTPATTISAVGTPSASPTRP